MLKTAIAFTIISVAFITLVGLPTATAAEGDNLDAKTKECVELAKPKPTPEEKNNTFIECCRGKCDNKFHSTYNPGQESDSMCKCNGATALFTGSTILLFLCAALLLSSSNGGNRYFNRD